MAIAMPDPGLGSGVFSVAGSTVFPGKGRWKKPNWRPYLETIEDMLRAAQKDPTVLEES